MKAFQRELRIEKSTPDLDQVEMQWWNRNSELIERIWGLPEGLCRETRVGYLSEIRALFHRLSGKSSVNILEVACGSGWPGRILADQTTRVTGVDFSEEQISRAEKRAASTGSTNCRYLVGDVNKLADFYRSTDYDGAFVHCGLHHLAGDELEKFAKEIGEVRPGYPLILVEPLYFVRPSFVRKAFSKASSLLVRGFKRVFLSRAELDSAIVHASEKLVSEADDRGWFLSPKEMPFTLAEIERLFLDKFDLVELRPVSHFALIIGQHLATLKDQAHAEALGRRWLPYFRGLDQVLGKIGLLPYLCDDYLFTLIALVRKKA